MSDSDGSDVLEAPCQNAHLPFVAAFNEVKSLKSVPRRMFGIYFPI